MDLFERRWRLIKGLLPGPMYRSEILEHLRTFADAQDDGAGLSEASVSADVKALRELGIAFKPLEAGDKQTKQAYHLDMGRLDLFVDPIEAAALKAALAILEDLRLPEAEPLRELFERVPSEVRDNLPEAYGDRFLKPGIAPYDADALARLKQGIRKGRMMRIGYLPLGKEPKRYLLDRTYLTWVDGNLYLHAYCPEIEAGTAWGRNREFRVDRICGLGDDPPVEVLQSLAAEPDVPSFEFELLLAPSLAPGFSKVPTRLRVVEERPDGSRVVAMRERIVLRAVRRVLSYGSQARVLGPDFIVEEVRSAISRMALDLVPVTS